MDIEVIRTFITDMCARKDSARARMWREPLVATATVDDRFDILPRIASPKHSLPRDLLPSGRSVIVFFIPFTSAVAEGNISGKFPSRQWASGKDETNLLLKEIGEALETKFKECGLASFPTPPTYNFDARSLMAQWSHKHLGHIVGLGRFGLNAQLITPAGCAGRMGSMITEADLGDHPLVHEDELCLEKKGVECSRCIRACPVQAISSKGIDRARCNMRLQIVKKRFSRQDEAFLAGDVCAKCVAGMPCSLKVPS